MNHALLLLTPPAHETAIYRQRERKRERVESKTIAQRRRGLETNSITRRVDSRKRGERLRRRTRDKKGVQRRERIC